MDHTAREEILEAYERHIRLRGTGDWPGLAVLFAEDARYFDPIFGWHQGRDAIAGFLERAMAGLAERIFTDVWHVADDQRLVFYWQCSMPGATDESSGLYHGMSSLLYAGKGLWAEQVDIYDREQAMSSRTGAQLDGSPVQ
ncbi:MAG: nuclear transport factor 2 family protein [bacterium]|nr:nuclear transport factor 2 family protein [bacterium]